jgi:hydroxymethylpyrimidine pyrophosphatase-like HAD family hydrolase
MTYEALALDLDETLIDAAGAPYPHVAEGLRALRERGARCFVATGRNVTSMKLFWSRSPFREFLEDEVVCSDGRAIYDARSGQVEVLSALDPALVARIYQAHAGLFDWALEADGRLYADSRIATVKHAMLFKGLARDGVVAEDLSAVKGAVTELTLFPRGPVTPALADALALPGTECTIMRHFDCIRIRPEGSKAQGVRMLMGRYSLPMAHVIAIGNGDNDRELLEESGLGLAVRDSTVVAKRAAGLVLPRDLGLCLQQAACLWPHVNAQYFSLKGGD